MSRHYTRADVQGQTASARALGCVGGIITIFLSEGETAWNPDGEAFTEPGKLSYHFTFVHGAACDMCLECAQCATCVMTS